MKATTCSYNRYKKYIVFLLIGMTFISIMFLLICLQTMAAEETQDIVRIGIYPLAGYNQVIDGNVSGYNYEYLHEIDVQAQEILNQFIKAAEQTAPDKEAHQMEWVGHMNNAKACAEEVINHELIYV